VTKMRLMLVDDHTVLRAGLRALFDRQADMVVVAEQESASGARAAIAANRPDVLVLDLTMPGGGGLELVRGLQGHDGAPRILVLTMHDDPAYARSALAAGAAGYVVKTVSEQSLLDAIRAVHRGQLFIDLDDRTKTSAVYGPPGLTPQTAAAAGLSTREGEVLALLGRGYSNQRVAERLDVSPKTVATYKARIADKLGLKTTADFVKYAADNGLIGPDAS
jgi:two-component system, NarL family, response regulator NreC